MRMVDLDAPVEKDTNWIRMGHLVMVIIVH